MAPTDEELVAAFQEGDVSAFDTLVGRWDRKIQGAIYRVLGANEDARDLCQEVFLKAYRALGGFKQEARFSSWLYQIALNACRDRLRRRRGRTQLSLDDLGDGGQELRQSGPTPFDLVEALRVAERDLPTALRRRLLVRLPVDLPKAVGDRSTITTILTELVTNADKYSVEGTAIELTAHSDERTVVFRVSDRGIGVRPEQVERAFDRFWQAESGDRRRYPGAGLGLYLVRRVIERQNGWVSLRPREGGGTIAEVRLPRG